MSFPSLSCHLATLAGLSGTFSIRDAWDKAPSGYVITVKNGQLTGARCPNSPDLAFDLKCFPDYMARGFGLLMSLSACCYEPRGTMNEDAMMLGEYNS